MKNIITASLIIAIASLAAALTSCSSTSTDTTPAAITAKVSAAADRALETLTLAEQSGFVKPADAEKLRKDIALAKEITALTGKIDFTNARATAASLAASGALPPNYALAIQGALLLSDIVR
jgi:hypothetical protein